MGNQVYPTLPGLAFNQVRQPEWKTNIHKAVSGKEFRTAWQSAPLYTFRLQYEFLRDAAALPELQQLVAFFNSCQGSFDSFLYADPTDKSVTAQQFGTGNGVQTAFQLVRSFGGNAEAVGNLNGAPQIYKTNWQGRQLQYSTPRTNIIKMTEAISNSAWAKSASGTGVVPAVTDNYSLIAAPDGTFTATRVQLDRGAGVGAANFSFLSQVLGPVPSVGHVSQLWARAVSAPCTLAVGGCAAIPNTVTLTTAWQRFDVSILAGSTEARTLLLRDGYTPTHSATADVLIWHPDIKEGDVVSSYIPNSTTSPMTVTDYNFSGTGLVTFSNAPKVGEALDWTGNYYYRCRFLQDSLEFNKFLTGLWEAKKVEFIGSLTPNRI